MLKIWKWLGDCSNIIIFIMIMATCFINYKIKIDINKTHEYIKLLVEKNELYDVIYNQDKEIITAQQELINWYKIELSELKIKGDSE
jgi:hypothetical protein